MSLRPSLDEYYMAMLDLVSSRSTCVRRRVGAIIITETGKLLATGYNGVPARMPHCIDKPCAGAGDKPGDNNKCLAIHAEQNAIIQAGDRLNHAHTIYTSTTPCFNCSKLIVSSGIAQVVSQQLYADSQGLELMFNAGIQIFLWNVETKSRNLLAPYGVK